MSAATATLTATWAKAPNGEWAAKIAADATPPAEGDPITVVKRDGTEKVVYATSEAYYTRYGVLVLITNRAPNAPEAAPLAEGVYVGPDGEYVMVTTSDAGNLYGKVWDGARFAYVRGSLRLARAGRPITADEAAAFGHTNHRCCFCARKLSRGESTAVGYGPDCADKYGLPWGVVPSVTVDTPEAWEAIAEAEAAAEAADAFARDEAAAEAEWRRRKGDYGFEFDTREETGWNRAL